MRKQLRTILNIIMGSSVGVFLGHALWQWRDYKAHPQIYGLQSAPWYTSILVYGAVTLGVLLAAAICKALLKRGADQDN